jgi:hypothetical protein
LRARLDGGRGTAEQAALPWRPLPIESRLSPIAMGDLLRMRACISSSFGGARLGTLGSHLTKFSARGTVLGISKLPGWNVAPR